MDAGACDETVGGDEERVVVGASACDEAEGCNEEDVAVGAQDQVLLRDANLILDALLCIGSHLPYSDVVSTHGE